MPAFLAYAVTETCIYGLGMEYHLIMSACIHPPYHLEFCKQWSNIGGWDVNVAVHIKAKQPESGDLCGNITEFEVVEGDPSTTPSEVILPYSTPDEGCFYCYILLFNRSKSFQAKIYEINMYLLLYFFFFNPQCRNTSHCNTKVT